MANFISPNGDYPRHTGDIQLEHPSYQYGDAVPEGWVEVALVDPPECDYSVETLIELEPQLVAGVMTQRWATRPYTEEELATVNAPITAKAKLIALGLTEAEIQALSYGLRF